MSDRGDGNRGDIAIVGMAGVFPKAPDVASFWENILAKVDAVTDAPPLWGADLVYDPTSVASDRIYTKRGGFISELSHFNPLAYGIPPRSIEGSDPEHFIALRVAHEALVDAGYLDRPFDRARTAVILGRSTVGNRSTAAAFQHGLVIDQTIRLLATLHPEYTADELERIKSELREDLPPFNSETAPGLVPSVMCGRIANRLDLMGPAYTVDAACASSLLAVELAMADLVSGKIDMALAGGVQTATTFMIAMIFCQLGALSRRGTVGSFSPDADGTLLGEGAGILVLKRRADAERDNDRIYALLKAVGVASDGRAFGMLAPRAEGQELAIRRAYELAGIATRTVSLIEGHGTGTPVGDAVELEVLDSVFGAENGDGPVVPWCALGSIKSMIGHPIPAAGAAGLIKAALALYHKVLPPTLHADAGNPKVESTPFYLNTETRPWIHAGPEPRRAAVSAFGFGGINAHAILEEHAGQGQVSDRPQPHLHRNLDAEVVVLSAAGRGELLARGEQLRRLLADSPDLALVDVAYTMNCPVSAAATPAARLAMVATSISDLEAKLGRALDRLAEPGCHQIEEPSGIYYTDDPLHAPGALAFVFPGMGAQYVNMLAGLCIHFPAVRSSFDRMDQMSAEQQHGFLPSQAIFPPPSGPTADPDLLWSMRCGFAAVLAGNQALHNLLGTLDIQPDAVVGHSMGANSALGAARAASTDEAQLADYFFIVNERYEQLRGEGLIPNGALLAITTAQRQRVLALVERSVGALTVALDNCPHQIVLGGSAEAANAAADELRQAGISCAVLPFDHPYHTSAFAAFSGRMREMMDERRGKVELRSSGITLYSCITAAPCPDEPEAVAAYLTDQISHPVRFRETIEAMYRDGARIFVEVGPRGNLSASVDDTLRGMPHLAVPADVIDQSGPTQLAHLVGLLAAHHVPMNLAALYTHRSPQRLSMDHKVPAHSATDDRGPLLAVHLPFLELAQPVRPAGNRTGTVAAGPTASRTAPAPAAPAPAAPPPAAASPAAPARTDALPQPSDTPRDQVMQAYLATMDRFLDVQRSVLHTPAQAAGQLPAPASGPRFPLLGSVLSLVEGEELVAIRRLDIDEDLFLHDHTFGRQISVTDSSLLALPVVPFTVSMEMLAEAAAALRPGQLIVGIRDVRGYQWIGLDDGHATLRLVARRDPAGDGNEVKVELQRLDEDAAFGDQAGTLVVEGVVRFADCYPTPPAVTSLALRAEQPYAQSATALYASGRMFHGPRFQGVVSLARWGEDGTEATLHTLPTHDLFASTSSPTLVTDMALLDAAGQLVGFWAIEHLRQGVGTFPFALRELRLFQPSPAPGTPVRGLARIAFVNERQVRAEIDLVGPDGHLVAQLAGWTDHCLDLTTSLFRATGSSLSEAGPGAPWKAMIDALPAPGSFFCWRIDDLSPHALVQSGRLPQRILAMSILSRRERATWANLAGTEQHRSEWLLGRAAAKEAVCAALRNRVALDLYPADIDIVADERGSLVAAGSWAEYVDPAPLVSLAHCDGVAVAIAGADRRCQGVGVHLVRIDGTDDGVGRWPLDPHERALLAPLDGPGQLEWALRLRCAKEAAGQALGRGSRGTASLVTAGLDLGSGVVQLDAGPPPTVSEARKPEPLIVHTVRDGDWIAASAIQWEEPTDA
ncbi:MAG TPA: beta-ketoacyl synthase N-terminal-like domain-containing protein [Pseudonocardiaceae bacterium]